MTPPSVRVLLTTFNGQLWLPEQLASLEAQEGVRLSVVVSDDLSTDGTLDILAEAGRRMDLQVLPTTTQRFGNANRNFLRLIREAPLDDAQYVALADQDDVWLPRKLARAVETLQATGAVAYSADVTAFWPDGREVTLRKAGAQRRYDYLFESAGPGCTFVIRRDTFLALRAWVDAEFDRLQHVKVHDWLIYARARTQGWPWIIDTQPTMRYRQHGRNEVGANAGLRAAWSRLRELRQGIYLRHAREIGAAVDDRTKITAALRRMGWRDRLTLTINARQCRRSFAEACVLAVMLWTMPAAAKR